MHRKIIELTEFVPRHFVHDLLSEQEGQMLWTHYNSQVAVQLPTVQSEYQWVLTSQGWVGFIPLSSEVGISLNPKVPLANLFGMLAYAHDLKSFHWLGGLFQAESFQGFYEQLALLLAQQVIQRCHQGIYREYVTHTESLPYVRGSLQLSTMLGATKTHQPICRYEEQSADIVDNQILTWALHRILQGALSPTARPIIRQAYRQMRALTTLKPCTIQDCQNQRYHRLNEAYRGLHGLAAFFLTESSPSHEIGENMMVPFLVDMARLYERFVATWLVQHIGPEFQVQAQERQPVGSGGNVYFNIDLIIYDVQSGKAQWVMDTKYKSPQSSPSTEDIAQAIAYAQVKGTAESILVYPVPLSQPLDVQSGGIRIRSLTFALNDDLEEAGNAFLTALFGSAI